MAAETCVNYTVIINAGLERPAYPDVPTNAILLKFSSPLSGKIKDGGGNFQGITSFDQPVLSDTEGLRMNGLI